MDVHQLWSGVFSVFSQGELVFRIHDKPPNQVADGAMFSKFRSDASWQARFQGDGGSWQNRHQQEA